MIKSKTIFLNVKKKMKNFKNLFGQGLKLIQFIPL